MSRKGRDHMPRGAGAAPRGGRFADPPGHARGLSPAGDEAVMALLELTALRTGYGAASRAHRFSSIRLTGQKVADPPKSSAPAAKTFAPAGVS